MTDGLTPSIRVARVAVRLAEGERLTTMQVAELCGISRQGAYQLLERISTELALVLDDGEWFRFDASTGR